MTNRLNDPLLATGRVAALVLQGLSALAGGIFGLITLMVILDSVGILPDFFEGSDGPTVLMFPLPGLGLCLVLALLFAALFLFFGRLRAFIGTVGEGDPFIPENARRLNMLAWLVLAVLVLAKMVGAFRDYLAGLALQVEGSGFPVYFGREDIVGILTVIILFTLARSFRQGAAMRDDLEGTV